MDPSLFDQVVLYENDALVASYADGSGIELSACATCFVYHHARSSDYHPIHGHRTVQQRSEFATSDYKKPLQLAVDFRNEFAVRPFLCRELIDASCLETLHDDVCEIAWPATAECASYTVEKDLSITLTSKCSLATLSLDPSRQHFTVTFLCRTSRQHDRPRSYRRQAIEEAAQTRPVDSAGVTVNGPRSIIHASDQHGNDLWLYARVTVSHSIEECPEQWLHALKIAQEIARSQRTVTFESDLTSPTAVETTHDEARQCNPADWAVKQSFSNKSATDVEPIEKTSHAASDEHTYVTSTLPQPLWLNCHSPHLHRFCCNALWESEERFAESAAAHGRIKVMRMRGVTYRFLWEHPRALEIYPGDGSTLRSHGLSGSFFIHYHNNNNKIEEVMYSVERPPPDIPGAKYSTGSIIRTAARFLPHLFGDCSLGHVTCCWKDDIKARNVQAVVPTIILEECSVAGVGRFTAYSSGRVRILFTDRTSLDMHADFSKRLGTCQQHSQQQEQVTDIHRYQPKSSRSRYVISELPQGVAKLLLPSGHYDHVILSQPGQHHRYVKAALEWVAWVNSSPSERHHFYKDTLHDTNKRDDISRELSKISCFNYIVEKTLLSDLPAKTVHDLAVSRYNHGDDIAATRNTAAAHTIDDGRIVAADDMTSQQLCDPVLMSTSQLHSPDPGLVTSTAYDVTTQPVEIPPMDCDMNFDLVQQILNKTSQTVSDLDSFLSEKRD